MKKSILTTLLFAVLYFLCMGIGVLLGGSKHGAGAFLPGIICGLLADGVANLGKYKDQTKNLLSFLIFAFSTSGPILLMWITPKAYMATLLARGKSQEYIDRIMVAPNPGTVLLFIASIAIGALVGALIGQALSKKLAQKI